MSTEKGQKMTLKMSTGRNKIPLYFILRVIMGPTYFFQLRCCAFEWITIKKLHVGFAQPHHKETNTLLHFSHPPARMNKTKSILGLFYRFCKLNPLSSASERKKAQNFDHARLSTDT